MTFHQVLRLSWCTSLEHSLSSSTSTSRGVDHTLNATLSSSGMPCGANDNTSSVTSHSVEGTTCIVEGSAVDVSETLPPPSSCTPPDILTSRTVRDAGATTSNTIISSMSRGSVGNVSSMQHLVVSSKSHGVGSLLDTLPTLYTLPMSDKSHLAARPSTSITNNSEGITDLQVTSRAFIPAQASGGNTSTPIKEDCRKEWPQNSIQRRGECRTFCIRGAGHGGCRDVLYCRPHEGYVLGGYRPYL